MKPRRRRKASFIVPVVSMGDIAFLLIVFFVLCSNFAKEAGQAITPARSEDIDTLKKARILVAVDDEGIIYCDGSRMGGADELESRVLALIDSAETPELRSVQLKVGAAVGPEVYKPVLEALAKAGATIEFVGEKGPRRAKE